MSHEHLKPPLTVQHFAYFGQIITGYASCEITFKALLGLMTGTDPWVVHTLTHGMNGPALLLKIKAVNSQDIDATRSAEVSDFLRRLEKASVLRNEIAHGSWMPSQKPEAIRPSGLVVKAKGAVVLGFEESERDYTLSDLDGAAEELVQLGADVASFLKRHGFDPVGELQARAQNS